MVGAHQGLYKISLSSRKGQCSSRCVEPQDYVNTLMTGGLPKELADDLCELCLEIVPRGYLATLEIQSTLMEKIREAHPCLSSELP